MANEAASGYTFLYSLFSGDGTLTALLSTSTAIFRHVAPVGTAPDWLTFGLQSAPDTADVTGVRIMVRALYRILAVGPESDYANVKAIADRADALLMPSGRPLRNTTQGGITILASYREQALALSEIVEGQATGGPAWINLGGLYRLEFAVQ